MSSEISVKNASRPMRWRSWALAGLFFGLALNYGVGAVAACVASTPVWEQMEYQEITVVTESAGTQVLMVKVADEPREWAAGFQHVCPDTIGSAPILFDFGHLRDGPFHMSNVYAPLDIGFFDENGMLFELQRMDPYILGSRQAGRLYRAGRPYAAALEAQDGFFSEHDFTEWHTRLILPRGGSR